MINNVDYTLFKRLQFKNLNWGFFSAIRCFVFTIENISDECYFLFLFFRFYRLILKSKTNTKYVIAHVQTIGGIQRYGKVWGELL